MSGIFFLSQAYDNQSDDFIFDFEGSSEKELKNPEERQDIVKEMSDIMEKGEFFDHKNEKHDVVDEHKDHLSYYFMMRGRELSVVVKVKSNSKDMLGRTSFTMIFMRDFDKQKNFLGKACKSFQDKTNFLKDVESDSHTIRTSVEKRVLKKKIRNFFLVSCAILVIGSIFLLIH